MNCNGEKPYWEKDEESIELEDGKFKQVKPIPMNRCQSKESWPYSSVE